MKELKLLQFWILLRYMNQDLKKKEIYNMLIILSPFICTNDPVLYDVLYKQ